MARRFLITKIEQRPPVRMVKSSHDSRERNVRSLAKVTLGSTRAGGMHLLAVRWMWLGRHEAGAGRERGPTYGIA